MDARLVDDGMAPAASDEPAVVGHGDGAGDDKREGEGAPEQQLTQTGLHRARHRERDGVVDDLHRRDARRVRGERDRRDSRQREARAQQRQAGQAASEQERQPDGEADRGEIAQAQRRADQHAEDLADGAAREAVQGRADRNQRELPPGRSRRERVASVRYGSPDLNILEAGAEDGHSSGSELHVDAVHARDVGDGFGHGQHAVIARHAFDSIGADVVRGLHRGLLIRAGGIGDASVTGYP
jgi:hypothetical protein